MQLLLRVWISPNKQIQTCLKPDRTQCFSFVMHDLHIEAQLPLTVRLTLASEVSPGTDGTAPTHLYSPTFSYFTSSIDSVPSWESTSDPWRNTYAQRDTLFTAWHARFDWVLECKCRCCWKIRPIICWKSRKLHFFQCPGSWSWRICVSLPLNLVSQEPASQN